MASRYGNQAASTDDIEQYIKNSIPINTTKQTNKWIVVYKQWAKLRNKEADIHTLPPFELDVILQSFYAEIKKQNGDDYEPNSLSAMQTSIDRYLKYNRYPHSILCNRDFATCRSVLEGKARFMRENGKGNRPNRAHSLTKEPRNQGLWAIRINHPKISIKQCLVVIDTAFGSTWQRKSSLIKNGTFYI